MNPFGSKIKALRIEKNLTQNNVGEIVKLSAQQISFLERGERNPSSETIQRLAKLFDLEEDELKQLVKEEMTYPEPTTEVSEELPDYMQQVVDFLAMIEEEEGKQMATKFLNENGERLLNLLPLYSFKEVKSEVINLRSKWISVDSSNLLKTEDSEVIRGCIHLDKKIYFSMEYNHEMIKLVLQIENFSHVKSFEDWIEQHHVNYTTEELIPHITEKQKVVHFLWFSPITSSFDKYQILSDMDVDLKTMNVHDNQLRWLIQSKTDTNDEDQVS